MKKLCNCESKGKMHCQCNKYIAGIIVILIVLAIWFGINKKSKDIDNNINTTKILVVGSGNEPGWNVKVYGVSFNQRLFKTDFILDYGDAEYSGVLGQSAGGSIDTNFQFRGDVNLVVDGAISTTTKNVILYFEKANCVDPSGESRDYTVDLNLNGEKEYKGCANLVTQVK